MRLSSRRILKHSAEIATKGNDSTGYGKETEAVEYYDTSITTAACR